MGPDTTKASAGWYADPFGRFDQRQWDGERWTDAVVDSGSRAVDPPDNRVEHFRLAELEQLRAGLTSSVGVWSLVGRWITQRYVWTSAFLLGGVLMIVGAFMPWVVASVPSEGTTLDRNGLQLGAHLHFSSLGLWPIVMGSLVAVIGLLAAVKVRLSNWILLIVLLAGSLVWGQIEPYRHHIPDLHPSFVGVNYSAGYGISIVLVGAAITNVFALAVGAIALLQSRR